MTDTDDTDVENDSTGNEDCNSCDSLVLLTF